MRAIYTAAAIAAVVLLSIAADAASGLKTKWSAAAGLTVQEGVNTVSAGQKTIYASSKDKLRAFDVSTGAKKWSISHPSSLAGYTVSSVKADDLAQSVFVAYQPGPKSASYSQYLYSFSATDGSKVWSLKYSGEPQLAHTDTLLLLASSAEFPSTNVNLLAYELATGNLKFNSTIKDFYVSAMVAQGDIAVVQGYTQTNGGFGASYNHQFDLKTGKEICSLKSTYETFTPSTSTFSIPMAGNLVVGQQSGNPFLYDAKTCKTVFTFTDFQLNLVTVNDKFYNLDTIKNTTTSYDKDGKKWSVKVNSGEFGNYGMLSRVPFQSGAIVANNRGIFSALNGTTGALMWNTSLATPFGPVNGAGQQIYPLGSNTLFIPNPQGYVVLQNQNNNIVTRNEFSPIKGTFSFMDSTTQTPFVVYGDLNSGNLVAVELSS